MPTIDISKQPKPITVKVVEVSDESINKIAEAVVRKLADRKTEPTISKMEQVDEPQTSKIIEAYSRGYADGANTIKQTFVADGIVFAKMDETQTEYERASEQREHDILYEPTYGIDDGSM